MIYPKNWKEFFSQELEKDYFKKLMHFVATEYRQEKIYPAIDNLFRVFKLVKPEDVKVVILGQDPYHGPNQANGIAFSTEHYQTPKSLLNMFKELKTDLNIDHFNNNDLSGWVEQGVFLINTILTVRAGQPLSHQDQGWEIFIENLLNYLANRKIIFCAFGNNAYNIYSKIRVINDEMIIRVGHPSPFSYDKYFKGSKPFTKINQKLAILNLETIDWSK